MIYGYARVSTLTQSRDGNSLEDQVNALREYGCQEIVTEAFSGKTMHRPEFQKLLNRLEKSDTLVVTKLDRFARTTIEGAQTVQVLESGDFNHSESGENHQSESNNKNQSPGLCLLN